MSAGRKRNETQSANLDPAQPGARMTALAWLLAVVASWPMIVVMVECVAGMRDLPRSAASDRDPPPFVVLMPAHDEAHGIGAAIAAVVAQLRPCDRMLVIADNCQDATAAIARRAGARVAVTVRHAPERVGKAYALACGREVLRANPPAVVVLLDADCFPSPHALVRLAATAARCNTAVQGRYTLGIEPAASPMVRISAFAFLIRNQIRQRGLQRIGGVAQLQGSGMAMPWTMFEAAPLTTHSLVEDLKLGLDLALAGQRVCFDDTAHVRGISASQGATTTQRTRWEQGMLATAATYLPRLIARAPWNPSLLFLAADLSVPPMAMLAACAFLASGVLACAALWGMSITPLLVVLTTGVTFTLVLVRTWLKFGQRILPAPLLIRLPHYLAWKMPIYARLVAARERRWVRTSRRP